MIFIFTPLFRNYLDDRSVNSTDRMLSCRVSKKMTRNAEIKVSKLNKIMT